MIFQDITNRQPSLSIKKHANLQPPLTHEPSATDFYCGLFPIIYKNTHDAIQRWRSPYSDPTCSLFLARNREVEWMFSSRFVLELHDDTIFHAVMYLDKYISLKNPGADEIQLIGAVCLALSSKVNEIYPSPFSSIVQLFKLPLDEEVYAEIESEILHAFDFQFPTVTVAELVPLFLHHYNLPTNILRKESMFSILQSIVTDFEMLTFDIKFCALAVVVIACKMKRLNPHIKEKVLESSEYHCAHERLTDIIAALRSKLASRHRVNNPENSSKAIEV